MTEQVSLYIESEEAERLAEELCRRTGEALDDAVVKALRERLLRLTGRSEPLEPIVP